MKLYEGRERRSRRKTENRNKFIVTSPHEYLFWRAGQALAVRSGDWKLFRYLDKYWLYNLNQDLGEQKEQSADQPAVFKRLKEALSGWESELVPPRWSPASIVDFELDGIKMKLGV